MVFGKKREQLRLDPENIPAHIAVIMDGNGRWAQKRGLPRTAGHSAGSEAFQRAAEHLSDLGVKYFTVYAFSTENWKRPQEEVGAIMGLLDRYLHKAIRDFCGGAAIGLLLGNLPGLYALIQFAIQTYPA